MFKLVAIAGKNRGQEYILNQGDNILGREDDCDIHVPIDEISKKHLSLSVTGDAVYLKDLGSANGTFLNGKLIRQATAKSGDKITLPDTILQVVYVKEKRIIIKKQIDASDDKDSEDILKGGPMPSSAIGKALYLFKYKFMNLFYGINKEYEWRILFAIILTLFVVSTITLTIIPIQHDSSILLLKETAKRGAHYADEIARMNFQALQTKNIDQLNTNFLDKEDDVESYELFDMEGRIVRPLGKMNEIITTPFSIKAREWALSEKGSTTYKRKLSGGKIGISQTIMAYDPRLGTSKPVGIISIIFAPRSIATVAIENQSSYMRALTISIIISIAFFGIIYFLTLRPIEEMNFQIEDALKGKRKEIEGHQLMAEFVPLRKSINVLLQRIRELQMDEEDMEFAEQESDHTYVQNFIEFAKCTNTPAMVLDSNKNIQRINERAEDVLGIREVGSLDINFMDVSREQGLAATVLDLCERSAEEGGSVQSETYEINGVNYSINVVSLIGKDNLAKAFYIGLIKE